MKLRLIIHSISPHGWAVSEQLSPGYVAAEHDEDREKIIAMLIGGTKILTNTPSA
jgi:hypothetical protein